MGEKTILGNMFSVTVKDNGNFVAKHSYPTKEQADAASYVLHRFPQKIYKYPTSERKPESQSHKFGGYTTVVN
jgi:hypothetical protein